MNGRKLKDEGHMRGMGKRTERSESERDSGFSDTSSEYMSVIDQTDTDETSCSVESTGSTSRSQTSRLAAVVGGGALRGLSPMIIMNNVVLKQSGDNPPLKPWSFSPAVEVVQQPQVVFLQPMIPQRTSAVSKGTASKRRQHKKYLPILKSYPKIAPHPGENPKKGGSTSSRSTSSSSSSSKLDCSQKDIQDSSQPVESFNTPTVGLTSTAHNTPADSDDSKSPHGEPQTSLQDESTDDRPNPKPRAFSPDSLCESASNTDNKLKRFCNTYNILSKSGLLDITLRTKELIRQNRRTQTELERLREQANLYVAALQTGDSGIWSRLQMSMMEENRNRREHHEDTQMIH